MFGNIEPVTQDQEESIIEFLRKLNIEGDVYNVVTEYGLGTDSYDSIPPEFAEDWNNIYSKAEELKEMFDNFLNKWNERCYADLREETEC